MRTGLPGFRDFCSGRPAREMEALYRNKRTLREGRQIHARRVRQTHRKVTSAGQADESESEANMSLVDQRTPPRLIIVPAHDMRGYAEMPTLSQGSTQTARPELDSNSGSADCNHVCSRVPNRRGRGLVPPRFSPSSARSSRWGFHLPDILVKTGRGEGTMSASHDM